MFALIFMTSTDVPQSQDSIKICPLSSINIFFMAVEVRENRNKLLHGWAAFLNLHPPFINQDPAQWPAETARAEHLFG